MAKVKKSLYLLFVLAMMDLMFTVLGIERGYLHEGNPVMAALYEKGIVFFILVKFLWTFFACLFLSHFANRVKWLKNVLYIPLGAYVAVVLLHFYYIGKAALL